jgi:GMP synthase-like glutamine amidotransferase
MTNPTQLKLQILQHADFESAGSILTWASVHGITTSTSHLDKNEALPGLADFNLLVVMGGPMNVDEEKQYSWLRPEKELIRNAINRGIPTLGICLGAQLIASALGARVSQNPVKEIGWYPVEFDLQEISEPLRSDLSDVFPPSAEVFHWHGDTFDLPLGAAGFASSQGCKNQAFTLGNTVIALQFHLEATPESIEDLIQNGAGDLKPGPFVAPTENIRAGADRCRVINAKMAAVMNVLASRVPEKSSD